MAVARKPSRRTAALLAVLPCAGLLSLAAPRSARAFTPAEAPSGGPAGPFANPFPDAATAPGAGEAGQAGPLQLPDYRYQGSTLPLIEGGLPTPGFTIVPRITLQEEFNDNILQTETGRRWDLITLLTPSLAIGANTPRLNLSLNYAPTFQYYARTHSQDSIAQDLLGVGNLVVVPDTFYVNARAYAAVTPTNGGYVGGGYGGIANSGAALASVNGYGAGSVGLSRQNWTQIYGVSLAPYLVHRFAEFGTATLGATFDQSNTSSSNNSFSQRATTEGVNFQFHSGPYFGRVQESVLAGASATQGSGVLNHSGQEFAKDRLGYALSRQLEVFGELGYENIDYSESSGYKTSGAIWRVGAAFTPNPETSVSLSYGHENGVTDFLALATYQLTPRTVLTASYSQAVTSYLQQVAAGYGQAGVNQYGVPINATTGLPLTAVNGSLAVQNTVYRNRLFNLGMTILLDRDTLNFYVDYNEQTPLTAGGVQQRSTTGTASWTRALSARATLTASFSYGTTTAQQLTGNSNLLSTWANFRYALSPTLTANASYLFFDRRSTEPGFSMYENLVLLGISKRF